MNRSVVIRVAIARGLDVLDQELPATSTKTKEAEAMSEQVVAKRDRLARDPMISAMVERLADRAGASVVSAAGEGNGDSPSDVLMRRMIDAFAEYERLIIKARTRSALAVKRKRREKTGGDVPYGYQLAADGVHLEENPDEQTVVAQVLELEALGLSRRKIAAELNRRGLSARRGQWHHQKVANVLQRAAA